MFLTNDDIIELTECKTTTNQITWLARNGIKFLLSHNGKPKVLVSHIEEIMGSSIKPRRRSEPDEKALMQHMGMM